MTTDIYQTLIEGDDNSSKKQLDDYLTEKEVAIDYPIYTVNSLRFFRSTQRYFSISQSRKKSFLQARGHRENSSQK